MKRAIVILAALIVTMAVLLPLASNTPDGLQILIEKNGNQQELAWTGIMADYSAQLNNPYFSSLAAGVLGIGLVILASYGVAATTRKKKTQTICSK